MAQSLDWVPMCWPCGPLDMVRKIKAGEPSAQKREILQQWSNPEGLGLLKGTPVNCLIVSWAAGVPQDSEQQRHLVPLIQAGQKMGLDFVGLIEGDGDPTSAVRNAKAAGLSAVAMEISTDVNGLLPVIPWTERSKVPWTSEGPAVALNKAVWPGIKGHMEETSDTAEAGPTGVPWVNSNGWLIQLAQTMGMGRKLWIVAPPASLNGALRAENYLLAATDSAAFGADWVVSLDDTLRAGLLKHEPTAFNVWRRLGETLSFFRKHRQWTAFRPSGVLGILSDFSGDNEFMGEEVLNLTSRRQLQFRVLEKQRCRESSFEGLKAVLYVDQEPPEKQLKQDLLAFVKKGGMLITSPAWGVVDGTIRSEALDSRYSIYGHGQGELAISKELPQDPYLVAADALLLLSHRNDLVRVWNGPATCVICTEGNAGQFLIQMVDYSGWTRGKSVSVWVASKCSSARLWRLDSRDPVELKGEPVNKGTEFYLPDISIYAALEML